MAIEYDGKTYETDANGYLVNIEEWSEGLAEAMAQKEGITLTQEHWDVINYLREEYYNNGQHQPNDRTIIKEMGKRWGKKVSSKDLYNLFPLMPSKQGTRIAGLPETRRKGGY